MTACKQVLSQGDKEAAFPKEVPANVRVVPTAAGPEHLTEGQGQRQRQGGSQHCNRNLSVSLCHMRKQTPAPSFLGLQQDNCGQCPCVPGIDILVSLSLVGRASKL